MRLARVDSISNGVKYERHPRCLALPEPVQWAPLRSTAGIPQNDLRCASAAVQEAKASRRILQHLPGLGPGPEQALSCGAAAL